MIPIQLKSLRGGKLENRMKMSDTGIIASILGSGVKMVFSKNELID